MRVGCVPLLLSIVLLAGCGGGGSSGGAAGTQTTSVAAGAGKTITISETEFKLDPATVNVPKPGTYVFKAANKGQFAHALTIEGNGVEVHTATIDAGSSATVKVTLKKGSYELYCPIDGHKQNGMKGTLTVGGGGGGSTGGGGQTTTNKSKGGYG